MRKFGQREHFDMINLMMIFPAKTQLSGATTETKNCKACLQLQGKDGSIEVVLLFK
jgi:hypothetical protein